MTAIERTQGGIYSKFVIAIIGLAIVPGIFSTFSVDWPFDADSYRDIAIAHRILNGQPLTDPFYREHFAWYSPGIPVLIASVAAVTGWPMAIAWARTGALANCLGPIFLFWFVRKLIGERAALLCTVAFLFLPGRPPEWASGTYTPWLFAGATAQGLLFGALVLWLTTIERLSVSLACLTGAVVGLAFLAHVASGMIAAGSIALSIVATTRRQTFLAHGRLALAAGLISILLTSTFLLPLWFRYGLVVVNRLPGTWQYELATFSRAVLPSGRIGDIAVAILCLVGLVSVIRRHRTAFPYLLAWSGAVTLGMIYSRLAERTNQLPPIAPLYHFFFALWPVRWVLAAEGVKTSIQGVTRNLTNKWFLVLVVVAIAGVYPRYLGRRAFVDAPREAQSATKTDEARAARWLTLNSAPDSVILAGDEESLKIGGAAGRFVVAVSVHFSNIYCDYESRAKDRDTLLSAIRTHDWRNFSELAARYGVTHAILRTSDVEAANSTESILQPVLILQTLTVFRLGRSGAR